MFMKKKNFLLVVFVTLISKAFSQVSEMRELPAFSKIEIESMAKIYLLQDSIQAVKVTAEDGLQQIETTVRDRTLHIDGSGNGELFISIPHIEKLSIDGKGEIIGQTSIHSDALELAISGNGKMVLETRIKELKTKISGLGKIILTGAAENTYVDISGSGKIDALGLKTANCQATISGLGKCTIDVIDSLTTNISGSGSVSYKNPPKNVNNTISGIGIISDYSPSNNKSDTTRLQFGKSQVLVISKRDSSHYQWKHSIKPIWQGFEMGMNSYMNSKGNFDLPPGYEFLELNQEKSVSVGLNLFQQNVELGASNIWFFTGLGITWNNYRFDNNVTLHATTPISATIDSTSSIHYIKSKLTVSYLTVPLMLEAFTSRNSRKAFHIGAGALLGLRLMSHTKQKYELDGDTFKPKVYNDFGLNPFRLGVRAAIGVHNLNIFADYYFSTLFKYGKGPSLYPVNIGITFVGF